MTSIKDLILQTEPLLALWCSLLQVMWRTLLKSNSDYMIYASIQSLVVQPISSRHWWLIPRFPKLYSQPISHLFFPVRARLEVRRQRLLRFWKRMYGQSDWQPRRKHKAILLLPPVQLLLSQVCRRAMRFSKQESYYNCNIPRMAKVG